MIHQTKGIVLRTIKYGETSVVVNIFTELFGIQSYLVNGVRSSGKTLKGKTAKGARICNLPQSTDTDGSRFPRGKPAASWKP